MEMRAKIWARSIDLIESYGHFYPLLKFGQENSSSSISDSIETLRKSAFENTCKNFSAIQQSDQNLRLF